MARILLVDDEPGILGVFQLILVGAGHEVRTTERGDDAIEIVRQGGVDLLVSDVRMSPTDGFQVLEQVLALRAELPVIMVSAYSDPEAIERATALGALAFLTKPLASADLIAAVDTALCSRAQAS